MHPRGTWSTGLDGLAMRKNKSVVRTVCPTLGLDGLGGEDLQLLGCDWAGDWRHIEVEGECK